MSTVLRGVATVFGIQGGTAAISGAASFTPKMKGQEFSHEYDKVPLKDGDNKVLGYAAPDGLIKGKLMWTVTGADIAAAKTALGFAAKLAPVTLSAFDLDSLNHARWIATSSKPVFSQGDHSTYELEIECSEDSGTDLSTAVT